LNIRKDEFVKETTDLVRKNVEKVNYKVLSGPLETLKTVDLPFQLADTVNQEEIAKENLVLGLKSCLGQIAVCGAIMEKHFPKEKIALGEVWEDFFANIMAKKFRQNRDSQYDPSFMREWLMYEEPHVILVINGKQFEPLSKFMGLDVEHPRVQAFPFWEGVAVSRLASVSNCEKDHEERLRLLDLAEEICPGMTLIRENRVQSLVELGMIKEAVECLKWSVERRPNARKLWAICHFMEKIGEDSSKYLRAFLERYPFSIQEYF